MTEMIEFRKVTGRGSMEFIGVKDHYSHVYRGIIPPLVSVAGYSILIYQEKKTSIKNLFGLLSVGTVVCFSILLLVNSYHSFIESYRVYSVVVIISQLFFIFWAGFLFIRINDLIRRIRSKKV